MKKTYFTVGPSQMYPSVPKHIEEAVATDILSLSHRGPEFQKLYQSLEKKLKELLGIPEDYVIFFLGSSIEAMERIIENTVEKSSFHFVDGAFSQKAADIADELGKKVLREVAPESSSYDFSAVTIPDEAELIFITENDTSTGLIFPHHEIANLKKRYPEKLVAVDLVSSAPYSSIDFSMIDMAFFSGQKGFGIPAGVSILVVSPEAIAKSQKLKDIKVNIGTYHNFPTLLASREKWMTPETPNVLAIYLFEKVVSEILAEGITQIRQEIDVKATVLYGFFDTHPGFTPLISDQMYRSPSTLVIAVDGGSTKLLKKLEKAGIVIGSGYGLHGEEHIRIANFPAHSRQDVKRLLSVIEE